MKRATVIAAILDELAPSIAAVKPRTGVDVVLKAPRAAPANGSAPAMTIKKNAGTPFEQMGGR